MRKTLVATAVAAILSAGAFLASGANAMTLTAPAGMRAGTEGINTTEQVRYVCYRVKRRGVWRRVCQWRPNRYVYGPRYYGYPYYYYGRPYAYRYGYPYGWYGYGYWGRPRAGVFLRF
jgi:hypothetical protein